MCTFALRLKSAPQLRRSALLISVCLAVEEEPPLIGEGGVDLDRRISDQGDEPRAELIRGPELEGGERNGGRGARSPP